MHYLLGLAALVMGAVIATRRTRPTWFVVLTSVLVGLGALLAILSYTRVTDSLGLLPNSIIGWTFVGLSIITMLSAVFVLERRGEHGEELPPLLGDNPFDGDTDDSDDPVVGGPRATSQDGVLGSDADVMAGDATAPLASPLLAHPTPAASNSAGGQLRAGDDSTAVPGHAGTAAATAAAFGGGIVPDASELTGAAANGGAAMPAASDPGAGARSSFERTEMGVEDPSRGAAAVVAPDVQHDSAAHDDAAAPDSGAPARRDRDPGSTAAPEQGH